MFWVRVPDGSQKNILPLFKIELIDTFFVFSADMSLGYGTKEPNTDMFEMALKFHAHVSDLHLFLSAFIVIIGISVEFL